MGNVSIVIPNWNGRELLERFFASVVDAAEHYRAESNSEVEVVVIDDASTDDSREWLVSNYGGQEFVRIIKLEKNLGFLCAVNGGFASAKYPIVFLLNSDVSVEPDCIGPLIDHFEDESIFAVCCHSNRIGTDRLDAGGKVGTFERGFWRVFLNYDVMPGEADNELISFFGSGGYTAYDREKWNRLGGFQECLSPNYWEDVEISYRAWKRGWKVLYEPASVVSHLGSVSIKKSTSKGELDIVSERNRLLMTWINLHDPGMFASHVFWVFAKSLGSVVSFNWNFLRSLSRSFAMLGRVRKARRIERQAAIVSDRELAYRFKALSLVPDIHILDSYEAEIAFAERKSIDAAKPNER